MEPEQLQELSVNSDHFRRGYSLALLLYHEILPKEEIYAIMAAQQKSDTVMWSINSLQGFMAKITQKTTFIVETPIFSIRIQRPQKELLSFWLTIKPHHIQQHQSVTLPGTPLYIPMGMEYGLRVVSLRTIILDSEETLPPITRVFLSLCWKLLGYVTPLESYTHPCKEPEN